MAENTKLNLEFINVKERTDASWQVSAEAMWKSHLPGMKEDELKKRLQQVVFLIQTPQGEIVGISTAFKAYVKQLKNHLYAFRCFIAPDFRIPGLTSTLLVKTRDYLEQIHQLDGPETERCIGMITLVENERIMEHRREAIWPASKMVYIGNSGAGKHIRVYYFKGAMI